MGCSSMFEAAAVFTGLTFPSVVLTLAMLPIQVGVEEELLLVNVEFIVVDILVATN